MKKGKNIKLATKLALAALVGVTSLSVYTVDAAGLTGSYVGIGKEPTSTDVLDKGTEVNTATDSIIDYRQTTNAQGAVFLEHQLTTTKTGKALMVNRQVIKMIQIAQATQLSVLVLIRLVTTVRPLVLMLKPLLVLQL